MASKGPRSKLDHETRARRQKALEAPKEPQRPKTHWDHVLEEMLWLSKDFESERKWKLAQAKRVAIRASRNSLDQATRGERRIKVEELRLRKVALNISKDVKKFWAKIEKLVLYKHQLELEERKKKALDKQLDFLLGQTERYSTMLAENLVDMPNQSRTASLPLEEQPQNPNKEESRREPESGNIESDEDYDLQSDDELEDDEHTIEEDEAHITEEERRTELANLQQEVDLPLEELLKRYTEAKASREPSPEGEEAANLSQKEINCMKESTNQPNGCVVPNLEKYADGDYLVACEEKNGVEVKIGENDGEISKTENTITEAPRSEDSSENIMYDSSDELSDGDYFTATEDEKDDETTLFEEEELARKEPYDPSNELRLLQQESEMPVQELLARYQKGNDVNEDTHAEHNSTCSEDQDEDGVIRNQHVDAEKLIPSQNEFHKDRESENIIADAAAAARSAQPTGNTFSTTKVRTKFPFLLKFPLREYQHIGLDWLVTMYEKRLNGILADEMGLGKTIMTIALLAHLACEKGIWGPHLIVVPTSVMLNWETEFLKWCPAFKILTYFGSAKERKSKRQGWLKPNYFHVCITTYRLVIQDSKVFKRKKWKYLILDEAHLIKNWKSQRWQTLLNFNSKRRILLTGTPLQNDLMELWSLMHFLMPHVFQSHQEFKDWFSNPISVMVEGQEKVNKEVVDRLHNVLRPFILRRLKRDVEKQLPKKYEHVVYCRLSRRQRNLYEDFIASSETQATLASTNFFAMISVIMQLRKVCNHPDLFEGRPIISSFDMAGIDMQLNSSVCMVLAKSPFLEVDLKGLSFVFTPLEFCMNSWEVEVLKEIVTPASLIEESFVLNTLKKVRSSSGHDYNKKTAHGNSIFEEIQKAIWEERVKQAKERAAAIAWWNSLHCQKKPVYGTNLRKLVTVKHPVLDIHEQKSNPSCYMSFSSKLADVVLSPIERFQKMVDMIQSFMFAIPAARAPYSICWCSKSNAPVFLHQSYKDEYSESLSPLLSPIRPAIVRRQVYFPDRRLIQFDCGKLQQLAILLRRLKSEGHRALIFTQMTKMLDILEAFISLYGYTYMRLDGSTQPEERQTLMQRFNTSPKIFLFILSTRSGGVGINLVGADTVIFYDSDWNPAMDQQAQDRCHRIGQTREVHIYRLISESTIEENILKKANQKRALDDLVIQSGGYNTEFFKKLDPMELFSGHRAFPIEKLQKGEPSIMGNSDISSADFSSADMEAALKHAEDEADYMALKKVEEEEAVDNQEFNEEAAGRLEDDDYVNDEDLKLEDKIADENDGFLNDSCPNNDRALTLSRKEEDLDIIAHVKQIAAAAAAAGEASSSIETQLRPIDRYAMRFLNLWDPIVDKSAIETQVTFEEEEWELDRIEKFKEDLEAEIDEDEEPFIYEKWDADFATEAYRQQVETLAQRRLMEELEEAKEMEAAAADEDETARNEAVADRKRKSKKKTKKTKFKSLKKETLARGLDCIPDDMSLEQMSTDDQVASQEILSSDEEPHSPPLTKRKKSLDVHGEKMSRKGSNRVKKPREISPVSHVLHSNSVRKKHLDGRKLKYGEAVDDHDSKPVSKSKMDGKISITPMPIKRVLMIRPEKIKKKGNAWSKDCIPPPDPWSSQEDAILCAVVHEYSTHWALVSDVLYGMTAGGFYRGRFRHPVHCSERFRELCLKYVVPATENPNTEKISSAGSGKALLKVTEEHVSILLHAASEVPNNELLLQKHFTAILSSVWRANFRADPRRCLFSMRNGLHSDSSSIFSAFDRALGKFRKQPEKNWSVFPQNKKLVAAALADTLNREVEEHVVHTGPEEVEPADEALDITLEFPNIHGEVRGPMPSVINLSICGLNLQQPVNKLLGEGLLPELSCNMAENRFRMASTVCLEGEVHSWASCAIPSCDMARSRPGIKSQLGKHKASSELVKHSKSKLPKIAESTEERVPIPSKVLAKHIESSTSSPSIVGSEELPCSSIEELLTVGEFNETIPHDYEPDILMGLEDCKFLTEDITDIG